MDSDERVLLTVSQAIDMLSGSESIHTFRNPTAGLMVGADWGRNDVLKEIEESESREVGGAACQSVGHGWIGTNS